MASIPNDGEWVDVSGFTYTEIKPRGQVDINGPARLITNRYGQFLVEQTLVAPRIGVPQEGTIQLWLAARRRKGQLTPAPAETRLRRKIERLIEWLGYDDVSRPQLADFEAYLDSFTESAGTVRDHAIYLRRLYKLAYKRQLIPSNPTEDLIFSSEVGIGIPFTVTERARIIKAAWRCQNEGVKWCILLAAYSGARIAELAEAPLCVVEEVDQYGVAHLVVYIRKSKARPILKTAQSVRYFTVHSDIADRFRLYLASIEGPALFPQFAVYEGRRGKDASNRVNRWLHDEVGISADKSFHSWRHTIATMLEGRKWGPWITGHAGNSVRSKVYLHPPLHEISADIESLPAV